VVEAEAEGGMRVGARESTAKQKGMSLTRTYIYIYRSALTSIYSYIEG
jgi:hypothetical protein